MKFQEEMAKYLDCQKKSKDKRFILMRANLESVPKEIEEMNYLEELYLLGNKVEELPNCLGNLSSLKVLNLANNKIKRLPENLGNLSNLEVLILRGNNLNSLPESLKNLEKLIWLDLSYNSFRDFPEVINNLPQLTRLNVTGNKINRQKLSQTTLFRKNQALPSHWYLKSSGEFIENPEKIEIINDNLFLKFLSAIKTALIGDNYTIFLKQGER